LPQKTENSNRHHTKNFNLKIELKKTAIAALGVNNI